jgi:hypothetical protein
MASNDGNLNTLYITAVENGKSCGDTYTGLFEMIGSVLTTWRTQYT